MKHLLSEHLLSGFSSSESTRALNSPFRKSFFNSRQGIDGPSLLPLLSLARPLFLSSNLVSGLLVAGFLLFTGGEPQASEGSFAVASLAVPGEPVVKDRFMRNCLRYFCPSQETSKDHHDSALEVFFAAYSILSAICKSRELDKFPPGVSTREDLRHRLRDSVWSALNGNTFGFDPTPQEDRSFQGSELLLFALAFVTKLTSPFPSFATSSFSFLGYAAVERASEEEKKDVIDHQLKILILTNSISWLENKGWLENEEDHSASAVANGVRELLHEIPEPSSDSDPETRLFRALRELPVTTFETLITTYHLLENISKLKTISGRSFFRRLLRPDRDSIQGFSTIHSVVSGRSRAPSVNSSVSQTLSMAPSLFFSTDARQALVRIYNSTRKLYAGKAPGKELPTVGEDWTTERILFETEQLTAALNALSDQSAASAPEPTAAAAAAPAVAAPVEPVVEPVALAVRRWPQGVPQYRPWYWSKGNHYGMGLLIDGKTLELLPGYKVVAPDKRALMDGYERTSDGTAKLKEGWELIAANSDEARLKEGWERVNADSSEARLKPGYERLRDGTVRLKPGYELLQGNARPTLIEGWELLRNGTTRLKQGWESLPNGTTRLQEGWVIDTSDGVARRAR